MINYRNANDQFMPYLTPFGKEQKRLARVKALKDEAARRHEQSLYARDNERIAKPKVTK